jgi:hypothetical protein
LIIGLTSVIANSNQTYAVSQNTGNTYQWSATGGAVLAGQGSNVITVFWGSAIAGSVQVYESNGFCNAVDTLNVQISGLSQNELKSGYLQIFPNPTDGHFYLKASKFFIDGELYIYDITGRIVHQKTINEDLSEMIIDVNPGIYQVHLLHQGKSAVERLIIY